MKDNKLILKARVLCGILFLAGIIFIPTGLIAHKYLNDLHHAYTAGKFSVETLNERLDIQSSEDLKSREKNIYHAALNYRKFAIENNQHLIRFMKILVFNGVVFTTFGITFFRMVNKINTAEPAG